jgi:hemolysin III
MPLVAAHRPDYSRAERLSDAVVHVAGLVLVLMAVPVLIVVTAILRGDAPSVLGVSIYGATMLAMIACSALYNLTPGTARAWLYRRLDHSAIYIKIAGTYTPFTLISGHGLALTAGVWGAAALGVALKLASPDRFRWAALALYLGMGWAGVVAGQALIAALPTPVLVLMVVGGLLYTAGVAFYLWERLPFHITIWHIFVLTATFVFYAAVVTLVVLGAA